MRALKIATHLRRLPEVGVCRRNSTQWMPLTLGYVGIRTLHFPYAVKLRDGCRFVLTDFADVATFWQVFFSGIYPIQTSDRVIVDAGGNVGSFSLYALRAAPAARVIAIEPFESSYRKLRDLVAENGFSARLEAVHAALGGESGTTYIDARDMPSQFRQTSGDAASGDAVRQLSLQQLFDDHDLGSVDLLKMDIEGSEYETLMAAPASLLRRIHRLDMEFHPRHDRRAAGFEQLVPHLLSSGFRQIEVRHDGGGYGIARFRRD